MESARSWFNKPVILGWLFDYSVAKAYISVEEAFARELNQSNRSNTNVIILREVVGNFGEGGEFGVDHGGAGF